MKGIILFDNLNDLAFMDADEALTKHIERLASKDGLLEDLSFQNKEGSINKNVVMQLFSPLIASYKVMQVQFGNKYKYIESEDGVLLIFNEIKPAEHQANKARTFWNKIPLPQELKQKDPPIGSFQTIGMVSQTPTSTLSINNNHHQHLSRTDEWKLTENCCLQVDILNYIAILICHKSEGLHDAQKELSLFSICVEMLYGPSLHMIKENISTSCDKISRSELLPLILKKWRILKMEQQMFLVEAIERLLINQEITALCINLLQEILEKIRYSHKEASYSHAFLMVDTKLLALYSSRNSGQLPRETLLILILLVHMLKRTSQNLHEEETQPVDDEFFIPISSDPSKVIRETEGNVEEQKPKNTDNKPSKLKIGAQSLLIYLKSRSGILVPHVLYVIEAAHNIYLVVLSELTRYAVISSGLSSLCKSLHSLQNHPSEWSSIVLFENLEANFRSLIESIWKMKEDVNKDKNIKKLVSKWEQLKQSDIESAFQVPHHMKPRLESSISSMCELLKLVFEEVIATQCLKYEKHTQSFEHQEILIYIQKQGCRRLLDVGDYLEVKAMQNITMASYISDYPGLIHFIYVDRNCDCLIAPSVVLRKGHLNGTTTLKKKIWNMVSVGRRYLDGANKYCCLWKDDDLYFFYSIWFENSSGKVIKPTVYPDLKRFPEKGIICGNFYKKLVEECFPDGSYDHIFCYEIFCVHLDSTPIETIVDHSRKLCAQLWDFTGAYRTSLDLL